MLATRSPPSSLRGAQRRSNPHFAVQKAGLLRFARNDEMKIRSRDAFLLRPRFADHHNDKALLIRLPHRATSCATKRGAERREAHPVQWPPLALFTSPCGEGCEGGRQRATQTSVRNLRTRPLSGRARLPALHCGSRQGYHLLAQLQAMLPGRRLSAS